MKVVLRDGRRHVLRFDPGDEVVAGLVEFMGAHAVRACTFSGIGTSKHLVLGFYDAATARYEEHPFAEDLEIATVTGTGATLNGKPAIHVHGSFGRRDCSTLSGHVLSLVVAMTCEVFLIALEGELVREYGEGTNLNLLKG